MELKPFLIIIGAVYLIVLLTGIFFIVSTLNHNVEKTAIQNNKTSEQTYNNLTQLKIRVDKTLDQAEANYGVQKEHEENAKISRQNTANLSKYMVIVLKTHEQILAMVKNISKEIDHFLVHQHNNNSTIDVKPLVITNKTGNNNSTGSNNPIIIINASKK